VHRATLALGATGVFAVVFRHHLVHAHAYGQTVAVIAIGSDYMVVVIHDRDATHGHRFLADIKMEETADLATLVAAKAAFLETTDPQHVAEKLNLLVRSELGVDGRLSCIISRVGDFGLFWRGSFLSHGN